MLNSWFGQSSFNKKCEKFKVTINLKFFCLVLPRKVKCTELRVKLC